MALRREIENLATIIIALMVIILLVPTISGNIVTSTALAKTFTSVIYLMIVLYVIKFIVDLFKYR